MGIRTGGRVLAVNSQTRTLTLDREITLPSSGTTLISLVDGQGSPVSVEVQSVTDGVKVKVSRVPDGVAEYSVWGLKLPTLRQRLFRCVSIRENDDGTYAITAVQHVPEKEAIVDIENTPDGMQSQVLLAADRIAMVNPANGNTKPMFVGQGDQIFMNDVFLKRLTAPTITSGGNPPAFSLTPDGKLTAKNADISGSVNANAGTLNNVTVNENCTIKGMLEATQVRGDFVKAVSKSFPKQAGTWGNTETPNGTVTVTISDDHNFDRQIIIPPIIFNGIAYSDPGSGNNAERYWYFKFSNDVFLWRGWVVQTGYGYHATSEFHRLHRIDWWRWLQRRFPTSGRHFRTGSTSRQWKPQRNYRGFVEAYSRRINEFRLDQHIRRYI